MVAAPMMTWQASKGSPVGKARVRCLKHCSSCHDKQAQSPANQLTRVQVHGGKGSERNALCREWGAGGLLTKDVPDTDELHLRCEPDIVDGDSLCPMKGRVGGLALAAPDAFQRRLRV